MTEDRLVMLQAIAASSTLDGTLIGWSAHRGALTELLAEVERLKARLEQVDTYEFHAPRLGAHVSLQRGLRGWRLCAYLGGEDWGLTPEGWGLVEERRPYYWPTADAAFEALERAGVPGTSGGTSEEE